MKAINQAYDEKDWIIVGDMMAQSCLESKNSQKIFGQSYQKSTEQARRPNQLQADVKEASPLRHAFMMSEVNIKASLIDQHQLTLPQSVRNDHKLDFAQKEFEVVQIQQIDVESEKDQIASNKIIMTANKQLQAEIDETNFVSSAKRELSSFKTDKKGIHQFKVNQFIPFENSKNFYGYLGFQQQSQNQKQLLIKEMDQQNREVTIVAEEITQVTQESPMISKLYFQKHEALDLTRSKTADQSFKPRTSISPKKVKTKIEKSNINRCSSKILTQNQDIPRFNSIQETKSNISPDTLPVQIEREQHVPEKDSFCSLFVVYGLNHIKYINQRIKSYEILSSYPDLQTNPKVAEENNFIQSLDFICFPQTKCNVDSFKNEYLENADKLREKIKPHYFHFISTNSTADKKYLTSINFKEILLSDQGAWIIPKAILVASKQPIFSLQKQFLEHIYNKVVVRNNEVSFKVFRETFENFSQMGCYRTLPDGQLLDQGAHQQQLVTKYMIDIIMRTKTRNQEANQKKDQAVEQVPLDMAIMLEIYVAIFCKHLYYNPMIDRDIQIIILQKPGQILESEVKKESALFSSNLKRQAAFGQNSFNGFMSSQNGGSNLKQEKNRQKEKSELLFKFRNTSSSGFHLENYNFELLLQTLKPDKIIQLFTALLLERKIVLIKKDVGDIALIMQSLIALLNPFNWSFIIITYLTNDLVEYLEAPVPYLIGVSSSTWSQIMNLKEYPEDIIIFDLETQERKFIPKFDIPELPKPFGDDLLAGLKDIIYRKEKRMCQLREELQQQKNINFSTEQQEEQYWADAQLSVKQLFFNFLLLTVNDFTKFKKQINVDPFSNEYQRLTSNDLFDFEAYLDWQDEMSKKNRDNNVDFIRHFIITQAFNTFIEKVCTKQDHAYFQTTPEQFFELNLEIMQETSFKKLKATQQDFLDRAKENLAQPVKFNFAGFLSKYALELRQQEEKELKELGQEQGNQSKFEEFKSLTTQEQIDDVLMKYIFRSNDTNQTDMCNNLTIITTLNKKLLPDNISKIKYDCVEVYWQKKYGNAKNDKKKQGSELAYSTDISAPGQSISIKSIEFAQKSVQKELMKEKLLNKTRSKTQNLQLKFESRKVLNNTVDLSQTKNQESKQMIKTLNGSAQLSIVQQQQRRKSPYVQSQFLNSSQRMSELPPDPSHTIKQIKANAQNNLCKANSFQILIKDQSQPTRLIKDSNINLLALKLQNTNITFRTISQQQADQNSKIGTSQQSSSSVNRSNNQQEKAQISQKRIAYKKIHSDNNMLTKQDYKNSSIQTPVQTSITTKTSAAQIMLPFPYSQFNKTDTVNVTSKQRVRTGSTKLFENFNEKIEDNASKSLENVNIAAQNCSNVATKAGRSFKSPEISYKIVNKQVARSNICLTFNSTDLTTKDNSYADLKEKIIQHNYKSLKQKIEDQTDFKSQKKMQDKQNKLASQKQTSKNKLVRLISVIGKGSDLKIQQSTRDYQRGSSLEQTNITIDKIIEKTLAGQPQDSKLYSPRKIKQSAQVQYQAKNSRLEAVSQDTSLSLVLNASLGPKSPQIIGTQSAQGKVPNTLHQLLINKSPGQNKSLMQSKHISKTRAGKFDQAIPKANKEHGYQRTNFQKNIESDKLAMRLSQPRESEAIITPRRGSAAINNQSDIDNITSHETNGLLRMTSSQIGSHESTKNKQVVVRQSKIDLQAVTRPQKNTEKVIKNAADSISQNEKISQSKTMILIQDELRMSHFDKNNNTEEDKGWFYGQPDQLNDEREQTLFNDGSIKFDDDETLKTKFQWKQEVEKLQGSKQTFQSSLFRKSNMFDSFAGQKKSEQLQDKQESTSKSPCKNPLGKKSPCKKSLRYQENIDSGVFVSIPKQFSPKKHKTNSIFNIPFTSFDLHEIAQNQRGSELPKQPKKLNFQDDPSQEISGSQNLSQEQETKQLTDVTPLPSQVNMIGNYDFKANFERAIITGIDKEFLQDELDMQIDIRELQNEYGGVEGIGATVRHSAEKISLQELAHQSHFRNKLNFLHQLDSINYVTSKKDQQSRFNKISTHLGDVDNDPHTPRSNGSQNSTGNIQTSKRNKKRHHQPKQNKGAKGGVNEGSPQALSRASGLNNDKTISTEEEIKSTSLRFGASQLSGGEGQLNLLLQHLSQYKQIENQTSMVDLEQRTLEMQQTKREMQEKCDSAKAQRRGGI